MTQLKSIEMENDVCAETQVKRPAEHRVSSATEDVDIVPESPCGPVDNAVNETDNRPQPEPEPYCFDAATATGAPLVANRRTISYGRPPAVAHGPSVTLF